MMTEYEVVRDGGAGLIDLSAARGRVRVSGSEATMFLNGLITNDVKNLAQNRWMPAVFPTVQGRLIGAGRGIRGGEAGFLIDTDAVSHDAVLKTISRFTLAGDFKVSDVTSETALLSIQGQGAAEILENDLPVVLSHPDERWDTSGFGGQDHRQGVARNEHRNRHGHAEDAEQHQRADQHAPGAPTVPRWSRRDASRQCPDSAHREDEPHRARVQV